MRHRILQSGITIVLGVLLWAFVATPVDAHWADQAVAEIKVLETAAEMVLSFPTGLVAWADDNRSGALDPAEVERQQPALERFLSERVRFTDRGRMGKLTIEPAQVELPSSLNLSASHTTLKHPNQCRRRSCGTISSSPASPRPAAW